MRLAQDENAWTRGFEDGELGLPLRACPYDIGSTESWSWSSGHLEGKAARNGYAVIRPAPKQQEELAPGAEADAVPLRVTSSASAPEKTKEKGVNIARRSGVNVRRRLTLRVMSEPLRIIRPPVPPELRVDEKSITVLVALTLVWRPGIV